MRYLQIAGYRVIPVNPNAVGSKLHGATVVASLADADERVDLVNVFRRSDGIPQVVDDAIAAGAPAIWTQLGIRHEVAMAKARTAGLRVVTQRCISVEHGRLVGDPMFRRG